MRRTERGQPYPELVIGRLNVRCILQRHLNESTALIFNAAVVGANQFNQIALRLVRNHFQNVG